MFHVFCYLYIACSILFVKNVEGPLSRSLSSLKLGMDDPCADENKASGKTSRSIWHSYRSTSSSEQPRSYTFEVIHATGNRFFREFEFEHALQCYNKAVDRNSARHAKVYRNRGLCLSRLGWHDLAILDFEKSLELEPDSVRGRYFLGREYLEVERLDESKTELKKALHYGDEQNMVNDEKLQINIILHKIRRKKREMDLEREKIRHGKLFEYLKDLLFEDAKRKIFQIKEDQEDDDDDERMKIEKIVKNLDQYLDELKTAFFAVNSNLQPASVHEPPEYLVDKISLGLMRDPVTTPSGITYENTQIRLHLESDARDPTSRDPIKIHQLRPNKALRHMIRDYMKKNGLFFDEV